MRRRIWESDVKNLCMDEDLAGLDAVTVILTEEIHTDTDEWAQPGASARVMGRVRTDDGTGYMLAVDLEGEYEGCYDTAFVGPICLSRQEIWFEDEKDGREQ